MWRFRSERRDRPEVVLGADRVRICCAVSAMPAMELQQLGQLSVQDEKLFFVLI